MTVAYIGLGSNIGDTVAHLCNALEALNALPECQLQKCSPFYRSAAIGPGQQADYANAVASIETLLGPEQLLRQLQAIESAQGRQRSVRWGPRTLDLDLLLHGETVMRSASLELPHPRMTERSFVLLPLFDISPKLRLPNGTPIRSLLASLDRDELEQLQTPDRLLSLS